MAMKLEAADGPGVAQTRPHGHGADAHADTCANCGATLTGPFCHRCGQHAHVHKSLLHLGEEVLHGILHFDAKGWRTLPMLIARPGELTRRYIDGQRTRFVSPLALFLFLVFFLFFVASITGGKTPVDLSASLRPVAETPADVARAGGEVRAAARPAASEAAGNKHSPVLLADSFIFDTNWPAADAAIARAVANPALSIYKLKSSGAKYSFLLVPISLPFLWLLFARRRGVTMYDHAVFSLYSLSFMALMFALVFAIGAAGFRVMAGAVVLCVPPVHMFLQLRGAYSLSRGEALWRTMALLCMAGVVFVLYSALILLLTVA